MLSDPGNASDSRVAARISAWARSRIRVFVALFVLASLIGVFEAGTATRAHTAGEPLSERLRREGLIVTPGSVRWVDGGPSPLAFREVVFLAREEDGAPDVYYAAVRATGSTLFDLVGLTNVTRTPGAAEASLVKNASHLAFLSVVRGTVEAVTLLDLEGEPRAEVARFSTVSRIQRAITNLEETGRTRGFGRTRYTFLAPLASAALVADSTRFLVRGAGVELALDPHREAPVLGASLVRAQPQEVAEPGGITWVVDTIRNLRFVGPEPIAWLEHHVYGVKDWALRTRYRVLGEDAESKEDVAAELGVVHANEAVEHDVSVAAVDIGFPPKPLTPVVRNASEGEGEWIAIVDDPFVGAYPNAKPAFAQTHLRVDPERPFARVFLVAIDPRQAQLRMVSGTREPESANGATGTGLIPRDASITRVVAGFNGGFQAMHGEFGMMADRTVYLPPKPFAATVGVYDDGRVAMGSWTGLPEGKTVFTEEAAIAQIPSGMIDFRQNLTSVVEDGRINPWRRWYWGAAPLDANEQTFVDRSGLCVTSEGFLVYFWGVSMGADQLGEAMNAARCVRGMHLDMNSKHTAFEFYDIRPANEPFRPLARRLTESEFEVAMPFSPEFHVRGRKAVTRMDPLRFPRYVERDPRDYFYVALRPTLPGPDLVGTGDGSGFRTERLPNAGYPLPFARASIGASGAGRTWVVRIDASRAVPAPVDALAAHHATRELAVLVGAPSQGSVSLHAHRVGVEMRYAIGVAPTGAIVVLSGEPLASKPDARAAIGIDADGFLVYFERGEGDATPLGARLAAARVANALALPDGARLVFTDGSGRGPDLAPRASGAGLRFLANEARYAEVLFPDVAPRPYPEWGRIQDSRVRYVPEATTRRFTRPPGM